MSSDHAPFALRLFRYKSRPTLFGKGNGGSWKEAWLALYVDDTLIWFNDKHCTKVCGRIQKFSTTCTPLIKAGRVAEREAERLHPRRPHWAAPDETLYLTFPKPDTKTSSEWYWFYMKKDSDLLACLLHFAEAAGREGQFRLFIEQYEAESSRSVTKYKRFGASLKGDLKPFVLQEDIGIIWQKFVSSQWAVANGECGGQVNSAFAEIETETEQNISAIELNPQKSVSTLNPTEDSDLHDGGYYSSGTATSDSIPENCKDERSDSQRSANDAVFTTMVSVEIHSSGKL